MEVLSVGVCGSFTKLEYLRCMDKTYRPDLDHLGFACHSFIPLGGKKLDKSFSGLGLKQILTSESAAEYEINQVKVFLSCVPPACYAARNDSRLLPVSASSLLEMEHFSFCAVSSKNVSMLPFQ